MSVVSMKQLLEAGVHFGHQTRRWNPKMAPYIFTERNGIYIIDLQKTIKMIDDAYDFMREVGTTGKPVLFVGTKKQAHQLQDHQQENRTSQRDQRDGRGWHYQQVCEEGNPEDQKRS